MADLLRALAITAGAVVVGRSVRNAVWPRERSGTPWRGRPRETRLMWLAFAALAGEATAQHLIRLGQEQISAYLPINLGAFGLTLWVWRHSTRDRRHEDRR